MSRKAWIMHEVQFIRRWVVSVLLLLSSDATVFFKPVLMGLMFLHQQSNV